VLFFCVHLNANELLLPAQRRHGFMYILGLVMSLICEEAHCNPYQRFVVVLKKQFLLLSRSLSDSCFDSMFRFCSFLRVWMFLNKFTMLHLDPCISSSLPLRNKYL